MKNIFFITVILISTLSVAAQNDQLIVKSNSKGSYVEHKVGPKENFYSVGRLFNVHPKHIASFNSLDMAKGLSIGQNIRIPLSDTNYTHKSDKGTPVYYVTSNSETIYNVSTNNSVLMEKLRKWNQIPSDKLPNGTKLIVGYLTSNEAIAAAINPLPKSPSTEPAKTKVDSSGKTPAKNITQVKPDVKKEDKSKQEKASDTLARSDPRKTDSSQKQQATTETGLGSVSDGSKPGHTQEGYFRVSFDQQVKQQPITKEQTVTASVFKTSSGWSDLKYYVLMDGAEPGTIVKITNPTNNKMIYAKLLGEMTSLKENQGLNLRMSNAAAAALDITETDKFIVKVNY